MRTSSIHDQESISSSIFKEAFKSSSPSKFSIEDQGFNHSSLWRDLVQAFKIHHSNPRSSHHDGVIFLQDPFFIFKIHSFFSQYGFQAYNHGGFDLHLLVLMPSFHINILHYIWNTIAYLLSIIASLLDLLLLLASILHFNFNIKVDSKPGFDQGKPLKQTIKTLFFLQVKVWDDKLKYKSRYPFHQNFEIREQSQSWPSKY